MGTRVSHVSECSSGLNKSAFCQRSYQRSPGIVVGGIAYYLLTLESHILAGKSFRK